MTKLNKIANLPAVGVFFGKMIPVHRGHVNAIINAATQCQTLYVVISDNANTTKRLCKEAGLPNMPLSLRYQWLSQVFQDINHIKILKLDETNIPTYPNGWEAWTDLMRKTVPEKIDVFFCGEEEYKGNLLKYFPESKVIVYDTNRTTYDISATRIRNNPMENWNHIVGPARPFFAKKVLIAGTESSGKSTMVKYLAKLYNTSWSEEVGRYYAEKYLGGDETSFTDEDFARIAHLQVEQDYQALRTCNKICFFDTDAVVTQYYSKLYMGHDNPIVDAYINPDKYDIVFLFKPDVEWVDDGMRLNGDQEKREKLYELLKSMYIAKGFGDKIVEISGNYLQRLAIIINTLGGIYK